MQVADAVSLIEAADIDKVNPSVWTDLGCGKGMFTYALANVLSSHSIIHTVDKSAQKLQPTAGNGAAITFQRADFVKDTLPFSSLNGILMANALHFVKDKVTLIEKLKKYLAADGRFLIIEYNTLRSNLWVPFPLDTANLQRLFASAGFGSMRKLGERPSAYRNGNIVACEFARTGE